MIDTLHESRFADQPPAEVYGQLLSAGIYLCSPRTMYRLLASLGETGERRALRSVAKRAKPSLTATGPNQVWTWDITKMADRQRVHQNIDYVNFSYTGLEDFMHPIGEHGAVISKALSNLKNLLEAN